MFATGGTRPAVGQGSELGAGTSYNLSNNFHPGGGVPVLYGQTVRGGGGNGDGGSNSGGVLLDSDRQLSAAQPIGGGAGYAGVGGGREGYRSGGPMSAWEASSGSGGGGGGGGGNRPMDGGSGRAPSFVGERQLGANEPIRGTGSGGNGVPGAGGSMNDVMNSLAAAGRGPGP